MVKISDSIKVTYLNLYENFEGFRRKRNPHNNCWTKFGNTGHSELWN